MHPLGLRNRIGRGPHEDEIIVFVLPEDQSGALHGAREFWQGHGARPDLSLDRHLREEIAPNLGQEEGGILDAQLGAEDVQGPWDQDVQPRAVAAKGTVSRHAR